MIFLEDEPRTFSIFCSATCAFSPRRAAALDLQPGQLHRVASEPDPDDVDETKRNVLKLLAVAGIVDAGAGGLVGGTLQYLQPPMIGISS